MHDKKDNKRPVILDLCAGTGAWSEPYIQAGYDVRRVTLPENDVLTYKPPKDVHGILAAPPCTMFGKMRNCHGKPTKEQLAGALEIVAACMNIIWKCVPDWWALENPPGRLRYWLGEPILKFHPYEYGDDWTKGTWLWGNFNRPMKFFPVKPKGKWIAGSNKSPNYRGTDKSPVKNAMTPPGFARAFFEANP